MCIGVYLAMDMLVVLINDFLLLIFEVLNYGNYRMKKDYNHSCYSLLRIEEIPFLLVFK